MRREAKRLERHLARQVADTCTRHELLAPHDRVLVALSGGKDSYTMLHMLRQHARSLDYPVSLVAVHLDQKQPGYEGAALVAWLEESGVEYEVLSEDTYSVVTDKLASGSTYCSLCSRLRRGILYTAAERLGCTKLALGHHRDDGLETFLLNLFYAGKLQAMPGKFTTDDGRFEVIRPLIDCAEEDIRAFAENEGFPILPCNLCGSQEGLKRERVSELLASLERENPHVRAIMAHALGNVRPTHLLDPDVRDAWLARPAHLRPNREAPARETHFEALPVRRRRLPVVD
jgi:tRNA 2-thiocytidine biosynthesis protein TtcA